MSEPFTPENFVKLPVVRGVSEIAPLLDFIRTRELKVYIAGGYARYCLSNRFDPTIAGDVDLFPLDESAHEAAIAAFDRAGFERRHENSVSVTYKRYAPWPTVPAVQVIKPVVEGQIVTFGTIFEVLDNFDFTITRAALYECP